MVASIFASQQPAFRGGGGPVPPVLRSGWVFDLDTSKQSTYPGGVFPSNGATIASQTDQITGTVAAQSSAAAGTFVANAVNGQPGVRYPGSVAYTVPLANLPTDFYNSATPSESTQHYTFINWGSAGTADVAIAWTGATGRFSLSTTQPGSSNTSGVGITQTSPIATMKMQQTDTALHSVAITNTLTKIGTQSGTGLQRIYADGICQGVITAPASLVAGANGVTFGAINTAASSNSMIGTHLRYLSRPNNSTPIQVWQDTKAILFPYGKSMPTQIVIKDGSSLTAGTGADSAAYGVVPYTNTLLGKTTNPVVMNLGIGGIKWEDMTTKVAEVTAFVPELGAANVMVICCEGYNSLLSKTAAQAVADAVTYLRALIAGGVLPQNIYIETITGVGTARGGFARYPDYATGIKAIPSSNPDLALVNVIAIDTDPNLGLAADAVTNGGYYGNTATGSNGAGANPDGFNGRTCGATDGAAGDTVHRSGIPGFVDGVSGTISGYPLWSYRYLLTPIKAFLGL